MPFFMGELSQRAKDMENDIKRVEIANKAAIDNRSKSTDERLRDAEFRGLYRD